MSFKIKHVAERALCNTRLWKDSALLKRAIWGSGDGGEGELASHPPHTALSWCFDKGRPKQPKWQSLAGADVFERLSVGSLAQTGLESQATAPLNISWRHKAMPSLSSTWWRNSFITSQAPLGVRSHHALGAKKRGGRDWPWVQGDARFPGNTRPTWRTAASPATESSAAGMVTSPPHVQPDCRWRSCWREEGQHKPLGGPPNLTLLMHPTTEDVDYRPSA